MNYMKMGLYFAYIHMRRILMRRNPMRYEIQILILVLLFLKSLLKLKVGNTLNLYKINNLIYLQEKVQMVAKDQQRRKLIQALKKSEEEKLKQWQKMINGRSSNDGKEKPKWLPKVGAKEKVKRQPQGSLVRQHLLCSRKEGVEHGRNRAMR